MSAEEVAEPQTTAEREMAATCEREFCNREVFKDALVPIYVLGVEQQWCPSCVKDEFGLNYADYQNRGLSSKYITAKTVAAFALGSLLTLLVSVILIV